jgi:dolichol-phosphate mannosyltransferase
MLSVIVLIFNERENIKPLLDEIAVAAKDQPISEIIYIDDGNSDGSFDLLKRLKPQYPSLRLLRHPTQAGQSAAFWTGIKAAKNDLIVTLDGDGQNNPADIKTLYETFLQQKKPQAKVMVLGERIKRNDHWLRRLSSRIANGIRSSLLKDRTNDTGCSLKLFTRSDYLNLPYFNHMHRFLPALMMRDGVRLIHVPVSHRLRVHGRSKYGTLDRLFAGISDLRGVLWLKKRSRRAHFDHIYEELN